MLNGFCTQPFFHAAVFFTMAMDSIGGSAQSMDGSVSSLTPLPPWRLPPLPPPMPLPLPLPLPIPLPPFEDGQRQGKVNTIPDDVDNDMPDDVDNDMPNDVDNDMPGDVEPCVGEEVARRSPKRVSQQKVATTGAAKVRRERRKHGATQSQSQAEKFQEFKIRARRRRTWNEL